MCQESFLVELPVPSDFSQQLSWSQQVCTFLGSHNCKLRFCINYVFAIAKIAIGKLPFFLQTAMKIQVAWLDGIHCKQPLNTHQIQDHLQNMSPHIITLPSTGQPHFKMKD